MKEKFNPNHLQPGDQLNTLSGPAEFVTFKQGNFRNQNYQVKFRNGNTRWYTEQQLRIANVDVEPQIIAIR